MRKLLQVIVFALALVVASVPAWALGLGQMQVKSRLNEPFLAHIPIISNDPAELQELSAKLADPDTFIRVGLPLPDQLVSDLEFAIETGDDGKPFVKVTSQTPVALKVLDFLVEVRWSDGRLVREYTALMAAPNTIAGTPPVIEAPTANTANTIDRTPPAVRETFPHPSVSAHSRATAPVEASPVATAPVPETSPSASVIASGRTYGPIRFGETLGDIARDLAGANGDQTATMQQLLDLNREAFIGGNINRVKAGAVLRTPQGSLAVKSVSETERAAVAAAAPSVANRTAGAVKSSTVANTMSDASRTASASIPKTSSEARLKIVAPTTNNDASTTRSGGGKQRDGDMLQQQLQQANESIATKDAEINELKSRVADLERLKSNQARLIAIKDTQLASAEKNLETRQVGKVKDASVSSAFPWAGLAIALLAALILTSLAWFLLRRRKTKPVHQGAPRWMQDVEPAPSASSFVPAMASKAEPTETQAEMNTRETARELPTAEVVGDDHEALSRIAKARAYIVLGDKAAARGILQDLLAESLKADTRDAAEHLLATIH